MISIICGTNRGQSVSKKIALYYQNLLKEAGANSYILDLKELPEDFMNVALYDNAGKSQLNTWRHGRAPLGIPAPRAEHALARVRAVSHPAIRA